MTGLNDKDFLLTEYNALRRQMEQDIKQLGDLLRYALLASGGLWAWVLSHADSKISQIAGWLPVALSTLLLLQVLELRKLVHQLGGYLYDIEGYFDLPHGLGWEAEASNDGKVEATSQRLQSWSIISGASL